MTSNASVLSSKLKMRFLELEMMFAFGGMAGTCRGSRAIIGRPEARWRCAARDLPAQTAPLRSLARRGAVLHLARRMLLVLAVLNDNCCLPLAVCACCAKR